MKNKNLNNYINDKLHDGNGLPYKEEYWNNLNELLDANMPVNTTTATHTASTTAIAKTATGAFKLLSIFSVCGAVFDASFMYTRLFTSPTSSSVTTKTKTQKELITRQNSTDSSAEESTIINQQETLFNVLKSNSASTTS